MCGVHYNLISSTTSKEKGCDCRWAFQMSKKKKTKNRVSGRLYAQPTHPRHSKQPHYQPLHFFFVFEKCREKDAQFFRKRETDKGDKKTVE